MKNIYDIKKEQNLNFILPLNSIMPIMDSCSFDNILVVIHLHYEELLDEFLKYVDSIPDVIDVIFTTSNPIVQEQLEKYTKLSRKSSKIIKKRNRGRDVSSLLVACRTEILKYQYICFVHDKKEKTENARKDTEIFVKCIWENMVGSHDYILNIIRTFEKNPRLGVLLPPETMSGRFSCFFENTWYQNFELMQLLAKRMNLNCDLDSEKDPLSLGTAFWARVDALRKLFEIDWQYEDFEAEPLPDNGTISHALERSFAFIAQDAGYDTGVVMTDRFAGERMDQVEEILTEAFDLMRELLGIATVNMLRQHNQLYDGLKKFVSQCSHVYIYGAGKYGKKCLSLLHMMSCEAEAFVVSKKDDVQETLWGLPIIEISQLVLNENSGVIVAVGNKFREEIVGELRKRQPLFERIFCFFDYLG